MGGTILRLFWDLHHVKTGGGELPIISAIKTFANNYSVPNNGIWTEIDATNLKASLTLDVQRVCLMIMTGSLFFTSAPGEIDLDIAIDGVRVGDATQGLYRVQSTSVSINHPLSIAYAKVLAAGAHTFSPFAKGLTASGTIQGLDSGFGAGANQFIVLAWA